MEVAWWRVAAVAMIMFGLTGGLAWLLLNPDSEPVVAFSGTSVVRNDRDGGSVTVTIPPTTISQSVMSTSRTTMTTGIPAPGVDPAVLLGLREALAAWGRFATSGDLEELKGRFVEGGRQWLVLEAEGEVIRASLPSGGAYSVESGTPMVISVGTTVVVLRSEVTWSRVDERPQTFLWDVHMHLIDDGWQLYTVGEVS